MDANVIRPQPILKEVGKERARQILLFTLRDGTDEQVLVIDPLTWEWLALKIAEGIISGAAAKIFTDLVFGKEDLESKLAAAIAKLEIAIKQQIDANEKRKIEADTKSLQSLYTIYSNSPDTQLLTHMLVRASDVSHQALSLGILAVPTLVVVGGLELSVLQEKFVRSKKKGDAKNIAWRAHELLEESSKSYMAALHFINDRRFSPLGTLTLHRPNGPKFWAFWLDGQQIKGPSWYGTPKEKALEWRQSIVDREYSGLDAKVLGGYWPTARKWEEIAKGNFKDGVPWNST